MKNKLIITLMALLFTVSVSFAQTEPPLDGVYQKSNVKTASVTSYAPLREADVMWAKRVWRVIDLREKQNLPMTYPRAKLIDVIMDAVLAGELTAYNPNPSGPKDFGDEFKVPMTPEEVAAIGAGSDTLDVEQLDGTFTKEISTRTLNRDDIVAYRLKEEWFFDKQRSIYEPRIIGVAPVYIMRNSSGEEVGKAALFWIYFNDARKILAQAEVFNRQNDAGRLSYDDFFVQRLFSSYITKWSNEKDYRIEDYATGMDALIEANRIKLELFNKEHDLWEY
jgi:gliding motility associated protien GldN